MASRIKEKNLDKDRKKDEAEMDAYNRVNIRCDIRNIKFVRIFDKNFWGDEAFTINFLKLSIPEMIHLTAIDVHPPLYYIFAIFGYQIVGEYGGMYSWANFFVLMSFFELYMILKNQKVRHYGFFVFFSLCAAYMHYYALLSVVFFYIFALILMLFKKLELEESFGKLHNIEVIATILKNAVSEYGDYSKEEIMEFIDRNSFRDDMEVSPGRINTELKGNSTEYIALGEKASNFDYVFSARNPRLSGGKVAIKLHFDLEPQWDYRPGYPIEKRAYYYLARMMSSQLSVVTEGTDYGCLEKCYGIWICRDRVPQNERYTVSLYEIANTYNIGRCTPIRDNYDLMTLVVIRLGEKVYNGDEEDEGYELFDFLNLMMYPHNKDFIGNMSKYIDFSNNEELWKEANAMSGLGQSILEEGIERGIEQGIEALVLDNLEDGKSEDVIVNKLIKRFGLQLEAAIKYFDKYAKNIV